MLSILHNKPFKIITVVILRLLLGLFFVVIGFMRAVNPIGGAYKMDTYLNAVHMNFFKPISFVLAISVAAFEFAIGICTLLGTSKKRTPIYSIIFLALLLPFNFYNAFFAPVAYNDSFGDLLWQADAVYFVENIILLLMALILYIWRDYSYTLYSQRTEWTISIYSLCFSVALSLYCYINLPFADVSAYKEGADIRKYIATQTIQRPKNSQDTTIFRNFGHEQIQLSNGRKISAIQLYSMVEGDVTHTILDKKGYTFLLVSEDLSKASTSQRHKINDLNNYAEKYGYGFYCLTSTPGIGTEAEEYIIESCGAEYPIINADQQILRSMIRSNPGLILLKDGVIVKKWSNFNIPLFNATLAIDKSKNGEIIKPANKRITIYKIICSFIGLLIVILAYDWLITLLKWCIKKLVNKIKSSLHIGQTDEEQTEEKKKE